ncbi:MAG: cob(I)yrinic acid a,c-diamide adenosyltransferase [Oscillospiraceae bacterium]|jgi:cob(I)alamin adenosyltransferase|nr:cob(I)yrinic acid a,c-diamide adenosyltransferase [Oscillospiraceae bacterium]
MIHVYFGNGKGKTTAALGLLLRASGCGLKCVLVQFLKDWNSGELVALAELPNVTVLRGKASGHSFTKDMTEEQLAATRDIHNENLKSAIEAVSGGGLLVLDELLDAVRLNLLNEQTLRALLDAVPENLEVVITGHGEVDWITDRADYVTEMVKRRHPYDKGVTARRGVEF